MTGFIGSRKCFEYAHIVMSLIQCHFDYACSFWYPGLSQLFRNRERADLLALVCDGLLYLCHFPMWYPGSGMVLDCIDS